MKNRQERIEEIEEIMKPYKRTFKFVTHEPTEASYVINDLFSLVKEMQKEIVELRGEKRLPEIGKIYENKFSNMTSEIDTITEGGSIIIKWVEYPEIQEDIFYTSSKSFWYNFKEQC